MPRPPPCKLTISSYLFARWRCCSGITTSLYLFARWHLFQHVGCLRHQQQVDLWPFDLESGVLVTCDMGYLCANLTLPRPLCSRVRPDVCDRQATDRRQTKALLNASTLWGGDITIISATFWHFNRSLWRRVSPVNQMQFIFGQVILKNLGLFGPILIAVRTISPNLNMNSSKMNKKPKHISCLTWIDLTCRHSSYQWNEGK